MTTKVTIISMKRILILSVGMLAQIQALPAEEDAAPLLKAVQTKAMEARSLRVKCTLSMSKQNEDFARLSGEVCAKGANRWLFDFTGKIKGNDERFRGACDGDVLRMKGDWVTAVLATTSICAAPQEGGLTEESIRPFLTMVNKLEERGKFDEWRKHVAKDATFAYYRGPGKIGRHEMTVEEYWESMKDSDERTTVVSSEFVPNTITVMDDGRKAAVKATQVFVMRYVATKRVIRSESESDLVIRIHNGAPVIASSESTQLKLTLEPDQLSKQIRSTFSEQGKIDSKQAAGWVEEIGGRYFGGETQKLDMSFAHGTYGDEVLILASQLPDLKVIGVDSPYISDEGLAYIVGLKHLESLWLQCAGVTDEGLKTVSKVESLKMLVLMGSGVTDSGLPHLEKHKGLKMLGVSDTGVSEEGVKKLQEKRPDLKIVHESTIDQPAE